MDNSNYNSNDIEEIGKIKLNLAHYPGEDFYCVGIDHASFFGQINTSHLARFLRKRSCDRTAAGTDLQYLHRFVDRQPFYNIFPKRR